MLPEPAFAQVSTPSGSAISVGEAAQTVGNPLTTVWNNLWLRRDQQAYDALIDGDAVTAAQLFADQQWRGSARYRSGDFSGAAGDFAQDPSLTGLYNQGNALARLGRYQDAIPQYDQVLADDPNQEDAAFNKALLEKLLEQQQQQEQAEQQQQDQQQQHKTSSPRAENLRRNNRLGTTARRKSQSSSPKNQRILQNQKMPTKLPRKTPRRLEMKSRRR